DDTLASTMPTINISDAGAIKADGSHSSANNSYFAGISTFPSPMEVRDYFTFNLPAGTAPILGAELRVLNPLTGYISPDPTETYTLYDVSATAAALDTTRLPGDVTGKSLFDDLGTGTVFGTRVFTAADNN